MTKNDVELSFDSWVQSMFLSVSQVFVICLMCETLTTRESTFVRSGEFVTSKK